MHKRDWTWRGQPKVQGSSGHSFKLLVAVEKAAKGRGQSRISLIKCSSRIRVALLPSATNFRLLTHPSQPEYEPRHTLDEPMGSGRDIVASCRAVTATITADSRHHHPAEYATRRRAVDLDSTHPEDALAYCSPSHGQHCPRRHDRASVIASTAIFSLFHSSEVSARAVSSRSKDFCSFCFSLYAYTRSSSCNLALDGHDKTPPTQTCEKTKREMT